MASLGNLEVSGTCDFLSLKSLDILAESGTYDFLSFESLDILAESGTYDDFLSFLCLTGESPSDIGDKLRLLYPTDPSDTGDKFLL